MHSILQLYRCARITGKSVIVDWISVQVQRDGGRLRNDDT